MEKVTPVFKASTSNHIASEMICLQSSRFGTAQQVQRGPGMNCGSNSTVDPCLVCRQLCQLHRYIACSALIVHLPSFPSAGQVTTDAQLQSIHTAVYRADCTC